MTPESILAARRDPKTLAGYLELHIEQGPRLQSTDCQIGIVTGIVGIERYRITFVGRADHAGTVSMQDRQDAAQGAAAFILAGRRIVMRDFPDCVVNTGMLALEPGAMNVVTERARVGLEFRCAQAHDKATLETALLEQAEVIAQECELRLEIEKVDSIEAVQMSETVQHALTTSTERLGLRYHSMPSGAGHDAQVMSRVCQAGMIFVPSIGGVSHSPKESTNWDDCVNGANVLLQTVLSGF
jgi:N-carbamoyl-L-amino-acid hydrolase